MTATLIDGKASAAALRAQLTTDVAAFSAAHGRPPGLATVLIGDDAGSQVYVAGKQRACAEVGIRGFDHRLAADVPRDPDAQTTWLYDRWEQMDAWITVRPPTSGDARSGSRESGSCDRAVRGRTEP